MSVARNDSASFHNICLDRDILEVCMKARCDIRADEFHFSMESLRKAAYRQFSLWKYRKLGRGNKTSPTCLCSKDDSTSIPFSWWEIHGISK